MNDLTSAKDTLDTQSRRVFSDFVVKGYQHLGTTYAHSAALGQYLESIFENQGAQRRIRVSYLPPVAPHPDAMVVFLERGTTDSFAIDSYMRIRDLPAHEIAGVTLASHTGSLDERIGGCLDITRRVIEKYLAAVTCGAEWESVPIDWYGHK
jgi:hypothetical protein